MRFEYDSLMDLRHCLSKLITNIEFDYFAPKDLYSSISEYKKHLKTYRDWGTVDDIPYISSILKINILKIQIFYLY